nr:MAG: hypothetical protein EDM05_28990 [Leptolyngbya sp. IPPAS B-1204]
MLKRCSHCRPNCKLRQRAAVLLPPVPPVPPVPQIPQVLPQGFLKDLVAKLVMALRQRKPQQGQEVHPQVQPEQVQQTTPRLILLHLPTL